MAGRPRSKRTRKPVWGNNVIMANFSSQGRTTQRAGGSEHDTLRGGGRAVWAGTRLLSYLADATDVRREERGREYFREGNVMRLELESNRVDALVDGSQLQPFQVEIQLSPIAETRRNYLIAEFTENEELLRNLIAGYQPGTIEAELLFSPEHIDYTDCSCPDSSAVCKHVVAVGYAVEKYFADDPARILRWRNVSSPTLDTKVDQLRREIIPSQRTSQGEQGRLSAPRPALEDTQIEAESFWGSSGSVPTEVELEQNLGVEQGDSRLLNKALRTLVWSTPEMLQLRDDLEGMYEEMVSTPRMFD